MFFDTETLIHIPTWIDYVLNLSVFPFFLLPFMAWAYGQVPSHD